MRSYIIPMDDIEEHTHDDPIRQHEHNVISWTCHLVPIFKSFL